MELKELACPRPQPLPLSSDLHKLVLDGGVIDGFEGTQISTTDQLGDTEDRFRLRSLSFHTDKVEQQWILCHRCVTRIKQKSWYIIQGDVW